MTWPASKAVAKAQQRSRSQRMNAHEISDGPLRTAPPGHGADSPREQRCHDQRVVSGVDARKAQGDDEEVTAWKAIAAAAAACATAAVVAPAGGVVRTERDQLSTALCRRVVVWPRRATTHQRLAHANSQETAAATTAREQTAAVALRRLLLACEHERRARIVPGAGGRGVYEAAHSAGPPARAHNALRQHDEARMQMRRLQRAQ